MVITLTDMILDFPHQRNHQVVRFADLAQLHIVERHEDNETHNVARHELWYTESDYYSMKLDIREDVFQVRAQALAGVPFNYAGDDDASAVEISVCCVGIEHLLTPACMLEVKASRARCIRAVLAEQAKQDASEMDIALASFVQTRGSALRARKYGKLLQDSL
jgi:hypothetical protein